MKGAIASLLKICADVVYLCFGAAPSGVILHASGARYSMAAVMKAPAVKFTGNPAADGWQLFSLEDL